MVLFVPAHHQTEQFTLAVAAALVPLHIVRDQPFSTLGFLIDDLPRMLVFLESRRFLKPFLANPHVAAVITSEALAGELDTIPGLAVCERPKRAFFELQNALVRSTRFYAHSGESILHPSAAVHPAAWLSPEGVRLSAQVRIGPKAVVFDGCSIGERAEVRAGVVLGGTGFQTCRDEDTLIELTHGGGIEIGEDAIILENAVVGRGVFRQNTRIGAQSRVGAGAFVSHNVQVGARTHIGHGAIINGNVRIGSDAWIGPGAVVSNNLSIGDGARVSLGSVVVSDVAPGESVSGNFAQPHRDFLRSLGASRR